MHVFRSIEAAAGHFDASGSRSVVAIGNFDGVHCGHRAILADVCERARRQQAQAVVVTFDPHPLRVLRPVEAPLLLTPMEQRLALLAGTGVHATMVLPFTDALSRQSARSFAEKVLQQALRAVAVHEGDNFRFGYRAEAGVDRLRQLGAELGFAVVAHSGLHRRGYPLSSRQGRTLLTQGQSARARALLGRPFTIEATSARGRGIGARLLVPTVNLAPYAELKPAHGVYVTSVCIGKGAKARRFQAITNAGNRPTFGEDSYAIESHLLDFDPAISDPLELLPETPVAVSFLQRLRGEQQFPSPETLRQQIGLDIARARRYHALAGRLGQPDRW